MKKIAIVVAAFAALATLNGCHKREAYKLEEDFSGYAQYVEFDYTDESGDLQHVELHGPMTVGLYSDGGTHRTVLVDYSRWNPEGIIGPYDLEIFDNVGGYSVWT